MALAELIDGLGVNARVLMIGAHPDDEDTNLITWLQRGRHVETAYLSLTRGDGGQNLIGNELGEALGVIRTEELLAARRIDGARQYFTRAFDFGFSKDTIDTFKFWQRDTILGDVVRVVRAMRPHVIIAVFTGTPRDGHGHHQVSGLLARAAYDISGDSVRFPVATYGPVWVASKFYRRANAQGGTVGMDVGEYSPLLGRSYGEIAGESRSQHKSQGFGAPQRKGPIMNYVRREASRVNDATPANTEKTLFDGIDTSWARLRATVAPSAQRLIDAIPGALFAARAAYDPFTPSKALPALGNALTLLSSVCQPAPVTPCERFERDGNAVRRTILNADLRSSLDITIGRLVNAQRSASGVTLEAESIEEWAVNSPRPVLTSLYNNTKDTIAVSGGMVSGMRPGMSLTRYVPPGGVLHDTLVGKVDSVFAPWWMDAGRTRGMFLRPATGVAANSSTIYPSAWYQVDLGGYRMGQEIAVMAPIVFRRVDQTKGEIVLPAVGVPVVSVTPDDAMQFVRANEPVDRIVRVRLHAAPDTSLAEVRVTLAVPRGLSADSATRSIAFGQFGGDSTLAFRVRGRLAAGEYSIDAMAESKGRTYAQGWTLIDYDHIRRQRLYRPASIKVSVVDMRLPAALKVAYIAGVGDNIAPTLTQLGIPTTLIAAVDVAKADLAGYTTVVIGPRAYEAHPELLAANPKLFDFARKGGALVVQYGQYEMTQPGAMPFPITLSRPADRVTEEDAPIDIRATNSRAMTTPNRITAADFNGWVQERGLYMPRTFDPTYRYLLSTHDTNEPDLTSGVLVAPLGSGVYVYTTLSFFRQLPAGVPGAARLFVNLLSANIVPSTTP